VRKAIQPSGGGDRLGKTTAGEGETAAVGEGTAVGEEAETAVGETAGAAVRSDDAVGAGLDVEDNSLPHPMRTNVRIITRLQTHRVFFASSAARK